MDPHPHPLPHYPVFAPQGLVAQNFPPQREKMPPDQAIFRLRLLDGREGDFIFVTIDPAPRKVVRIRRRRKVVRIRRACIEKGRAVTGRSCRIPADEWLTAAFETFECDRKIRAVAVQHWNGAKPYFPFFMDRRSGIQPFPVNDSVLSGFHWLVQVL